MRQALINARIVDFMDGKVRVHEQAALAWTAGKIDFVGDGSLLDLSQVDCVIDAHGDLLLPALIDCHTHLVYSGSRIADFAARMNGASYAEIAARGGGILSTVYATRAACVEQLVDGALPRLQRLIEGGVATVEIKSGYGLDLASEQRMLQAARRLGEISGARVISTFLPLHALPPEYASRRAEYVRDVSERWLPTLMDQGLIDHVDAFVEHLAFSAAEARQFFNAARRLNIPVKVHAEQLSLCGASALGAEFNALSVDHLEHIDSTAIAQIAASQAVAVLLPGAFYALRETHLPPIAALRQARVPMAIATDLNPGTSPQSSLTAAMNQACVLFGLSTDEALLGVTRNAAQALGLRELARGLAVGAPADIARFALADAAELCYWLAGVTAKAVYRDGRLITS